MNSHPTTSQPTPAVSPTAGSPRRERVVWIDLFRGAAVLVMIETHVVNTFLAAGMRSEPWFAILNYVNGLVAPSFLFIAGFVQGMAWRAAPDKPVNFVRRARMLLGIGVIAYALHYPWTELAQHRWDDAIRVGSQVDVLQCIAASLMALLVVTWGTQKLGSRRGEMSWWLAVTALLLLAVVPAPASAHWNPAFVPLRAWVNFSTGSWFPLFPWAGFIFAGALAGAAYRGAEKWPAMASVPAPLALRPSPSAFLFSASVPLALSAGAAFFAGHSPVSLSSFLERTALVLLLAALCERFATRQTLPKVVLFAGQHSLTLYVAHLVLISTLAGAGVPITVFSLASVFGLLAIIAPISLAVTWAVGRASAFARASLPLREIKRREATPC